MDDGVLQESVPNHNASEPVKQNMAKGKPGKKKGIGLTPEKKKRLKVIIMQKVAEEKAAEAKRRAEEKEAHLKSIIGPLKIDGLNEKQLLDKVKELHKRLTAIEEEKYDLNLKIEKQDLEINQLNMTMNDVVKGKFIKPVLKRVQRTEAKFKKLAIKDKGDNSLSDVRQQLKSTGQSKYALEDKEESNKPDWLDHLKEGKEASKEDGH